MRDYEMQKKWIDYDYDVFSRKRGTRPPTVVRCKVLNFGIRILKEASSVGSFNFSRPSTMNHVNLPTHATCRRDE
jgi:hypothetical protein